MNMIRIGKNAEECVDCKYAEVGRDVEGCS
jgi:hypothetical protein